jgi:hypothetical protein
MIHSGVVAGWREFRQPLLPTRCDRTVARVTWGLGDWLVQGAGWMRMPRRERLHGSRMVRPLFAHCAHFSHSARSTSPAPLRPLRFAHSLRPLHFAQSATLPARFPLHSATSPTLRPLASPAPLRLLRPQFAQRDHPCHSHHSLASSSTRELLLAGANSGSHYSRLDVIAARLGALGAIPGAPALPGPFGRTYSVRRGRGRHHSVPGRTAPLRRARFI